MNSKARSYKPHQHNITYKAEKENTKDVNSSKQDFGKENALSSAASSTSTANISLKSTRNAFLEIKNNVDQGQLTGKIQKKTEMKKKSGKKIVPEEAKDVEDKISIIPATPQNFKTTRLRSRQQQQQQAFIKKDAENEDALNDETDKKYEELNKGENMMVLLSPRLDLEDNNDPQTVAEYAKEIFEHYLHNECKYLVAKDYLSKAQADINFSMRSILIDWLVDVHSKFGLKAETLYIAVSILDRFLSLKPISRHKLQLVGCTALWVASKYEEIFVPEVADFVEVCANAYTKDEFLSMEFLILSSLKFELTSPSPLFFLERDLKTVRADFVVRNSCMYLCELSFLEPKLLGIRPSLLAASTLYLSRALLQAAETSKNGNTITNSRSIGGCVDESVVNNPTFDSEYCVWPRAAVYYTGYTDEQLKETVEILKKYLIATDSSHQKLKAIYKKYSSSKRNQVALHLSKLVNN